MRHLAFLILGVLSHCAAGYCQDLPDTVSLYFRSGIYKLNSEQLAFLDEKLYSGHFSEPMEILGYADEPGALSANNALALRRARAAESWLLASGVDPARIMAVSGKAVRIRKGDNPQDRRVDIITVKKPAPLPAAPDPGPKAGLDMLPGLKTDQTLTLRNLLFQNGSAEFLPESLPVLEELLAALQMHNSIKIKIEGHICCSSPDTWVSEARAKAVYDFLVSRGIAAERLSYEGFGFSRPKIFPEETEADRVQNRRVEIRLMNN
jgi:outer membrane protein OmpA-like peptidoglycan-associated protein